MPRADDLPSFRLDRIESPSPANALGVKGAALTLYAIGTGFATLGVALSLGRARVVYVLAFMFAAFIGVTAIKIARKKQIEEAAAAYDKPAISAPAADATPPAKSA